MTNESLDNSYLVTDRRSTGRRNAVGNCRRIEPGEIPANQEQRKAPRRKVERRRQIDPTTCEREYTDPEIEFMKAMDDYKRRSGRQFPTWSEVLEVLASLGYRQVEAPTPVIMK